jgi:hypothetical protein
MVNVPHNFGSFALDMITVSLHVVNVSIIWKHSRVMVHVSHDNVKLSMDIQKGCPIYSEINLGMVKVILGMAMSRWTSYVLLDIVNVTIDVVSLDILRRDTFASETFVKFCETCTMYWGHTHNLMNIYYVLGKHLPYSAATYIGPKRALFKELPIPAIYQAATYTKLFVSVSSF